MDGADRTDDTWTTTNDSDLPHFEETILATTRYLQSLTDLTDADVRAPSACPGWSRGHVITHVARNADAFARVLRAVQAGTPATMYDTDEQRDADIDAGAGRSAVDLREDSAASWGRLLQAENELHDSRLDATFARTPGAPERPVRGIGLMRRTEIEVHHADLGLGYSARNWPADFAREIISRRQDDLADGPSMVLSSTDHDGLWKFGAGPGPEIKGALADLAWWLVGRGDGTGLVSSSGELPRMEKWR